MAISYSAVAAIRADIEEIWEGRDVVPRATPGARAALDAALGLMDTGQERLARVVDGEVVVQEWLRRTLLLLYLYTQPQSAKFGPFATVDKFPLKSGPSAPGVTVSPGAVVRRGSYQGPGVIVMPSHLGIGTFVDEDSLVDTWVGVGSGAQIGKRVHVGGGSGVGGLLEPEAVTPVVIEDDAFIGARSMIYSGARVGEGAVLGVGALLTDSIPVIDAATGCELSRGYAPPWTVAVPAMRSREFDGGTFGLPCLLVVKHLPEGERHGKARLNALVHSRAAAGPDQYAGPAYGQAALMTHRDFV
ncbi:2,3,4,5-tetrahydropyridine-2,6-dicarboxylate N-succinyltransferase [Streptomyces kanamyceticus]|uniref:2,3,4,5-tetrahydropyridine-2,6-dicarboxylate N-succinyltransferase n=1 Tax=Streptomyces kanamyceticus TaxID=1967 RepID=A0A5J6G7C6_STRKN|nr:2,3,4,5-tetrahydropyridine-2,6-dicarboxylate N-succinyltransferase [Streptomyces kanamyceticus]QEU89838.1 2,3,4,5-tetrahydropyridine-2,6-dicarboxylate N-succinyltransferase [Streptomyces kanamyceticus]